MRDVFLHVKCNAIPRRRIENGMYHKLVRIRGSPSERCTELTVSELSLLCLLPNVCDVLLPADVVAAMKTEAFEGGFRWTLPVDISGERKVAVCKPIKFCSPGLRE